MFGPVWPDKGLEQAKTQWAKGEKALGLRPLAVGWYVLRHLQERDVRNLRRAMKIAARDEDDEWNIDLGNAGYGLTVVEGQAITTEHLALMLEYLAMARVETQMDADDWYNILRGAFGQGRAFEVARIYARATGLDDKILFHELIGDEMRERLRVQRQVLIDSGYPAPVAYARPALHRYRPDAPELAEPAQEQMPLFGGIEGAAREDGGGEG
ncbi:hypothetical protein DA075_27830 [Methylobacterium currus]|uniref:Uncharacterized protein n=1 Tax=Methylobacterium currus TaxID=2051553 RepID=A0A2R4WRR5_9HYPH|nr:hypothetical protein DA075_27830 [Methylobacterium currus]